MLALFVLVVFVLPTPVARYVIEAQLENLGIQHDGIDTVDIDLWNSQVRAGPVRFHSGEAQQGQIGETGFDYSFGAFFEGRAFVQTFYLRGVDLYIARLPDGAIEINGINLQDLGAPEGDTAAAQQPPEEEEESGFEVGVERFEFSDSQLVFEDVSGGTLVIEIGRLTLDRLLTWTPEEPTAFALEGRLNEIDLAFDGTVVPLGDPLRFTFNSRVTGVTLDRVARFIGPTGLARQDGSLDTEVHYAYEIYSDGRVEGTVDGTYDFSDFMIATPDGATASLGKARLKVDLEQQLQTDGSASATGQLRLQASPLSVATAEGDGIELQQLDLSFADLDFHKGAEPRKQMVESGAAAGGTDLLAESAPSIVDLMIGWARELGREALGHQLAVGGSPTLNLKSGLLRMAARGETPGQELRFDDLSVSLGKVTSEAFDSGWSAAGSLESAATALRLASQGAGPQAELTALRMNAGSIDLRATTEETRLAFDLKVLLEQLIAGDDQGAALNLGTLSLTTGGFAIRETAEREEASGPLALSLESLSGALPGDDGTLALRSDRLDLDLPSFSLTGKGNEAASLSGSLEAQGLALTRDGEAPLSLTLQSTRSDLRELRVAPLGPQAEVSGGIATTLTALALEMSDGSGDYALSLDSFENAVEELQASGFGSGAADIALSNRTQLSGLSLRLPLGGEAGKEPLSLTLDRFENQSDDLQASGFGSGAADIALSNRTQLSGLSLRLPLGSEAGAEPLSVTLERFENQSDNLQASGFGSDAANIALSNRTQLSGLSLRLPLGGEAGAEPLSVTLDRFENQSDNLQASGLGSGTLQVSLANRTSLGGLTARLPLTGGETAEADIATLEAPFSELAVEAETLRAKGGLEVTGISAATAGENGQRLSIASFSLKDLASDGMGGTAVESIEIGKLVAKVTLPLPGMAGDDTTLPADEPPTAEAEAPTTEAPAAAAADAPAAGNDAAPAPAADLRFKVGRVTVAPGSRIEIADRSVEPPLQAVIALNELSAGPIDTGAPETRTDLALAVTANETSKLDLRGWAAPFKEKPDFDLTSRVEGFSLPPLSAYAAQMVGVNIESGALTADVAATASSADLGGNIDLKIADLFVTPLSEEEAEAIKADIGLPVGFAVSILKDGDGVIAFGLPLSGTLDQPQVDYSEAVDKAISGAMASIFPTNWFGPDGNTFEMQPAPFEPGTTKLTADGQAVADQMGELFADKPGISIRACGRAGREDLLALRGVLATPPDKLIAEAPVPGSSEVAPAAGGDQQSAALPAETPAPPAAEVAEPSATEVEALLTLAGERGQAIRAYLQTAFGIDPGRIPECRTAYSIKDGKLPRAEFQF